MGATSLISWTDATFNGVRGCVKYSPGCANCYAETGSHQNPKVLGYWGKDKPRVVGDNKYWAEPLKWNREAAQDGVRRRVFAFSLADVFEQFDGPMVDTKGDRLFLGPNDGWLTEAFARDARAELLRPVTYDDCRERLFALIHATPWLDWQLLTKRAEHILPTLRRVAKLGDQQPNAIGAVLAGLWSDGTPPANVWMGASAENERRMWAVGEHLRQVPAVVRWISAEPLLDYFPVATWCRPYFPEPVFDWWVFGGESGRGNQIRMCHTNWIRRMVNECRVANVPAFVKQLGALPYEGEGDQVELLHLTHKKGGLVEEWPTDLQVQEFPTPKAVAERRR